MRKFIRKVNYEDPNIVQKEIHLDKMIKINNIKLQNLNTKLNEIRGEYNKIFESHWKFNIPSKSFNSGLKQKINSLNHLISNISRYTQDNIISLDILKSQ